MFKAINHLITITKHRHKVIWHCFKAGIPVRGLMHDLSKYSPSEFSIGAKYYQRIRSPNEAEREQNGYSEAWMHHKGRNKHHFEYWTDYNPVTKEMSPVEMPKKYVVEMFCDRVAASKTYLGKNYTDSHPLEYFKKAKNSKQIHPKTAALLEEFLTILAQHGESAAFKYIRRRKNK